MVYLSTLTCLTILSPFHITPPILITASIKQRYFVSEILKIYHLELLQFSVYQVL